MKSAVLFLTILLPSILAACFAAAQTPGGWAKANVKDQGVVEAAKFAVTARQQALKKDGQEAKLEFVKVLHGEQQVVAGMNYKLAIQVKIGGEVKTAEAQVWARVWLKPDERYQLSSWKPLDDTKKTP